MREVDVATLLALANGLDQRHGTDDVKVQAWFALLSQEAPRMDYSWAQSEVQRHYGNTDDMLAPSMLVKNWRLRESQLARSNIDSASQEAHCGSTSCRCTHSGPCFKGWLDSSDGPTSPCRVCRSSLSDALEVSSPLGSRTIADHTRIANHYQLSQS